MKVIVPASHQWSRVNEAIKSQFGLQDFTGSVLAFETPYQAVLELTLAFSQLYSHKVELLCAVDTGPYWRRLAADGTRLGLRTHLHVLKDIKSYLGVKFQSKNLLASFYCEDDAVLGSKYDGTWASALNAEKSFTVGVVHLPTQPLKAVSLQPYEGKIIVINEKLTVALLGEKFRIIPFISPNLGWQMPDISSVEIVENQAAVQQFEAACVQMGAQPLISAAQRVWDRAAVSWPDIDGSAIREMLIDGHSCPDSEIETFSPCRWPLTQKFEWLIEGGHKPQQLRGSLIVSASVLNPAFIESIRKLLADLRTLQG